MSKQRLAPARARLRGYLAPGYGSITNRIESNNRLGNELWAAYVLTLAEVNTNFSNRL